MMVSPAKARWSNLPRERRNAIVMLLRCMGDDARTDPDTSVVRTAVAIDLYAAADVLDAEAFVYGGSMSERHDELVDEYLRKVGDWKPRGEIARGAGIPGARCANALGRLVTAGRAVVEKQRRGGRLQLFWRAVDAEVSP